MSEFAHLHGHSHFSNLGGPDALSSPSVIVERAVELGMESICVTDHASICGIPEFVKAAKKAGIKPIVGSELYVCSDPAFRSEEKGVRDYSHVIALAMNWDGFVELCQLLSKANGEPNFHYKPRNSFADLAETKNLIFTSACAGGILKRDDYIAVLSDLVDAVGPNRIYLEIQPHNDDGQRHVNARARDAREQLGLKLVAAQDFHYARPGDSATHEVILAIGTKTVWSDPKRWKYPVDDLHIKSKAEMVAAFMPWVSAGLLTVEEFQEAFATTDEIVSRLDFQWQDTPISLPKTSADPKQALLVMCAAALKSKGLLGDPVYIKRLVYELDVLATADILDYFIILADIMAWCRKENIMVGPGRGSSAGSLLCYLTGITTVDPIKHGLIFERFYRPGRLDLPDIDSDFEDERRGDVLAYITEKYGEDYVCGVSSYTVLKPKSAIKDVSRVFEINHMEANAATQAIAVLDIQIDDLEAERVHSEAVLADPAVQAFFRRYPVVEPHARKLCGWMRGTGQHAAGVVISGVPVADRAAIMRKDGRRIACWDKWWIEQMGLMKLDVLGLKTMTILRHAAENVWKSRARKIVYEDIPLDDEMTLKVFDTGETTGVFQCESHGMRSVFKECKIDRFSIIADIISLYRPGPMDIIPHYIQTQTGVVPAYYLHPLMEPILAPTYGVMIYQEQLMQVFNEVGGFSYTHADKMRKIVGKKLGPDEFRKHEEDFVNGALIKGVPEAAAREIFSKMVAFAGYGFNKSHAVSYAIIAYWTAFMKAHFPSEFWAAHLSVTDNEDKLALAVKDVSKEKIRIIMPDVNLSAATRFVPVDEITIVAPLTAIKGIGEKQAEMIVGAREGKVDRNGLSAGETRQEAKALRIFDASSCRSEPFTDGPDFEARVYARLANSRVKASLASVGAMPWAVPDVTLMTPARRELLGTVFVEEAIVDTEALLVIDELTKAALQRLMSNLVHVKNKLHQPVVMPSLGSEPRVMCVWSYPEFKDCDSEIMAKGKGWKVLFSILKEELGLSAKDFYVTALYKSRIWDIAPKAPKFDQLNPGVRDFYKTVLEHEIQITKPPVILALGADAAGFFADGAGITKLSGTVKMWNGIPVVFGISPAQIRSEEDADKKEELRKLAIALKEIIV